MQIIQNLVVNKEHLCLSFIETIQTKWSIMSRKVIIRYTPGYQPFTVEFYKIDGAKPYRVQKKASREHQLLAQQLADIHHEQTMP